MGYMGFGMRKEVYTRKPKEAFKKIKGAYGNPKKLIDDNIDYNPGKVFERKRFKHFYQTKLWKISIWSLVGIFILILVITTFIEPLYWKYKQAQFEETGINTFYNKRSHDFDKLAHFFLERDRKLLTINNRYFGDKYLIVQNINLDIDSDSLTFWNLGSENSSATYIANGFLTIKQKNSLSKTVKNNWRCSLTFKSLKDLHPSVFEYLNTSLIEMQSIVKILERNDINVKGIKNGVEIGFSVKNFGEYQFQYAANPNIEKQMKPNNVRTGIVRDSVFWVKYNRLYFSNLN